MKKNYDLIGMEIAFLLFSFILNFIYNYFAPMFNLPQIAVFWFPIINLCIRTLIRATLIGLVYDIKKRWNKED